MANCATSGRRRRAENHSLPSPAALLGVEPRRSEADPNQADPNEQARTTASRRWSDDRLRQRGSLDAPKPEKIVWNFGMKNTSRNTSTPARGPAGWPDKASRSSPCRASPSRAPGSPRSAPARHRGSRRFRPPAPSRRRRAGKSPATSPSRRRATCRRRRGRGFPSTSRPRRGRGFLVQNHQRAAQRHAGGQQAGKQAREILQIARVKFCSRPKFEPAMPRLCPSWRPRVFRRAVALAIGPLREADRAQARVLPSGETPPRDPPASSWPCAMPPSTLERFVIKQRHGFPCQADFAAGLRRGFRVALADWD
jgi:hypothetical protein